ncbi:CoA-acylating methylmalonate-semialdehyde dehydrogenase [Marinihelvus fidelis]|uniref:methylmalonate-semialdehyde dehydrogenase (CoA acylating) n=1 Tax=Marinihelvus fidelis TaxID=2613842 RepID=A0A5N0T9C1_9GAMM|nr:CoA-acylating methylmalonate-semialdehyde dehydrogenase [Marinihelvus fidelis]KAA9131625.1 CoA-acylating methylmalonate-semialdehyde dehydrogenase [Marinihelvus fidelis]
MSSTVQHYINGAVVSGGERQADIMNPALGAASGQVALADVATVHQAIDAAEKAAAGWRDVPPAKRATILFEYKRLLEENFDAIAGLITREHGKTFSDAQGELRRGIEVVDYACGAPELLKGEFSKNAGPGIDTWVERQPLGVVAGITPFNFPAMVPMWMFPMAIACGNAFILKPSEKDPSAAIELARLFSHAGLPDGVFNVVNGDVEAVSELLTEPRVQAVSFVGSTPVAEHIYRTASAAGKRVQALGGAKNCAVVMPDADLDNAASALVGAAYGSCGERCMAISVAICVGDETADALVGKISAQLDGLSIGNGMDDGVAMGPLITAEHLERVRGYVAKGVEEGADLVIDGRDTVPAGLDGYFLGGCLFDRVQPGMTIFEEEIFGPVLCVMRAANLDQAMTWINDHAYGNGTCVFTRDGESARRFTDRIQVGMVGVNVPLPVPVASHSFGGWKRSLFGDLYAYGPDAVRFYTRTKTISQRWPDSRTREAANFDFPSNG